ncbi:MAG TPA: OmpW family outer membrane protein [Bacteroidota bacterium]|nr:OmpW family outer membrane protein [Bacteroidota bacterium]
MVKILKTLVLAALLTATAMGQNQMSGITWNMGFPTGRMADFMDKTSFSGFGIDFNRFVGDNTSVGVSFSWNYWSELNSDIINLNNGAVSGTQVRYYNSFAMLLNARYYLSEKNSDFRPYAGINAGTYYITQRLDIGVYSFQNDHWHFGLAPEAGFLMEVSRGTYLNANFRYNYAVKSGTTYSGQDNTLAYWGINVGLDWATGWF